MSECTYVFVYVLLLTEFVVYSFFVAIELLLGPSLQLGLHQVNEVRLLLVKLFEDELYLFAIRLAVEFEVAAVGEAFACEYLPANLLPKTICTPTAKVSLSCGVRRLIAHYYNNYQKCN